MLQSLIIITKIIGKRISLDGIQDTGDKFCSKHSFF